MRFREYIGVRQALANQLPDEEADTVLQHTWRRLLNVHGREFLRFLRQAIDAGQLDSSPTFKKQLTELQQAIRHWQRAQSASDTPLPTSERPITPAKPSVGAELDNVVSRPQSDAMGAVGPGQDNAG